MSARRREVAIGLARGRRLVVDLGRDLDDALRSAGLSYAAAGRAVGVSGDQVARICRAESPNVGVVRLSALMSTAGLDLVVRAYPGGDPIRDAASVKLLDRFRLRLSPAFAVRPEAPVVEASVMRESIGVADRRAWDLLLLVGQHRIGVEAETRLRDVQALLRRMALKRRDGEVDRLLLVVNDTVHNRRAIDAGSGVLLEAFPGTPRQAFRALKVGLAPAADTILVV